MLARSCKVCSEDFFIKFKSSTKVCCSKECRTKFRVDQLKTHGDSRTKLYAVWSDMRNRCNVGKGYIGEIYRSRGIKICKHWNESFENFKEWSIKSGYKPHLEIDRKDNNKGYYPSNCRWVTNKQQSYNKRKRRNCSSNYKGVTLRRPGVWILQFCHNKKTKYCGTFRDELEAAKEYDKLAIKFFGKYACLNFPK